MQSFNLLALKLWICIALWQKYRQLLRFEVYIVRFKMFTLPWGILLRGMGLPSAIPSGLEIPTGRGRRSLNRRIAGLTPSAASSCARLRPKTKHSVWKDLFLSWFKEQHVWAIISNFRFWGKMYCHFQVQLLFFGLDFSELCFIFCEISHQFSRCIFVFAKWTFSCLLITCNQT